MGQENAGLQAVQKAMNVSPWSLFSGMLRPHRGALVLYGALLTVVTAIPLGAAVVLGHFVDLIQTKAPASQLATYAAVYAVLGLVASVMSVFVTQQSTGLSWKITDGLRSRLARQVLRAELSFHRDNSPGELVGRADDDVSAMAVVLSQFVAKTLAVVAIGVGATITLAIIQPLLAGPFVVCVMLSFLALWVQRNDAIPSATRKRDVMGEMSGFIEERFGGTDDLSSLGAGQHVVNQLAKQSETLIDATYDATSVNMRIISVVRVILSAGEVVMIAWGSALFFASRVDLSAVVIGWRFIAAVKWPIEQLTWRLSEVQDANGSAERVIKLLVAEEVFPERQQSLPVGPLAVDFEHVSFTFDDGDDPVIADLVLTVHPGRSLGLVGRSGSGKTSIGRLALRVLSPTDGRVMVGGIDLQHVDETDLRTRVAAVPQDVHLFPGTIRENVSMFGEATDEQILEALHRVGLDEWISAQTNGLDATLVGRDSEAGMSAGQAQLLSLARALLRNPDIVILDEATSRIDPVTQHRLAAATQELLRNRTSIVIAHRLETLSVCDDIAILDRGKVIEQGQREELLADPLSRFAQLLLAAQAVTGDHDLDTLLDDSVLDGSALDDTLLDESVAGGLA
jgi:ATP-binding cassette, subfamily B, bacterial